MLFLIDSQHTILFTLLTSNLSPVGGLIAVPVSGFLYDNTHNWDAVFLLFAFHYLGGAFLWSLWSSDQPLKNKVSPGIEV
jgi:hypothetical protein